MTTTHVYASGLAVLLGLAAVIGSQLRKEYRARLGPSLLTVAMVWTLYAVHFCLVALAAVESALPLPLPEPLALGAGAVLGAVGIATYLSAAFAFSSLKRMSGMNATRLVTEGIYRWSRNPQVVGWTLALVGLGLARRSGMVLLLAALFWVSYRIYLPLEEELLERLFGDKYARYRRRTHRYFGVPGDDSGP